MLTLTSVYITVVMVILVYMTARFVLALHLKNNSIADIGWGAGFVIATWAAWLQSDHDIIPTLALIMAILWGLSLHILQRNAGKAEDWRYEKWRREWGQWFVLRSYLQVFVLQGILLCIIASPAIWLQTADMTRLSWLSVLGISLWLTGFGFEAVADYQLKTFLTAKRIMTKYVTWAYGNTVGTQTTSAKPSSGGGCISLQYP
ncbi:DUF1295 domain-containing protein [bacterium]|nr:DUF1295 domain-containing protein [bacterium]